MSSDDKAIEIFTQKINSQLAVLKRHKLDQFSTRAASLEKNMQQFGGQIIRGGLVGITSSGKSSLLNTLLGTGTKMLKEQSKATTNMIVFCSKAEEPVLEIYFEEGRPFRKTGKDVLSESIWKYTSEDENPQNKFNVKFIKLAVPTFMLDDDLEIADTPGLDAFGHKEHEDLTLREFLPQANLIIYLSSIRSPMKEADRKIINKIMDADQRIIFVQTCKGAVVEQKFDEEVRTVEKQLLEYREKFEKEISQYENLKDSPIVQVETTQAMEYFKTGDKNAWRQSGLDELIFVVSETTGQIREEFKFIGLRRLVDETLSINQLVTNMLKEEDDKASALEHQTSFLAEIENCQEEIMENIEALQKEWNSRLNFESLYSKYNEELSALYTDRYNFNPMHDKKFLAKAQSIDDDIKLLKGQFLDAIDNAKKKYAQMLTELGMDVRRMDYQNVSKQDFFLPNVQKKRVADALGKDKKKTADITDEYVDKNKYIKDLEGSLRLFIAPLTSHFEWWIKTMELSFVAPLTKKTEAINDDIANVEGGIIYDEVQKQALIEISNAIEEEVRAVLPLFDKGAIGRKIKAYSRYIGRFETVSIDDRNIFLQLSNRLFENLFHSHYLECINAISTNEKKMVLLASPHHESEVHFLRRLMRLDQSSFNLLLENELPFSVNAPRKIAKMQNFPMKGELQGQLSFIVLGNDDKSLKIAKEGKLFEKADVVQVLVEDLHRVGSAIGDLVERFKFFSLVREHKKKLLITYPAAAHFQRHKLHMLVNEVMVEVDKIFHPDKVGWFVYENYETRYGYFSRLARKMGQKKLKVDAVIEEWKELGLPLDDPFSEDVLFEQFREVAKGN